MSRRSDLLRPSVARSERSGPTICILAGDVSGDQNGGRLARALKRADPGVRLIGAGGASMRDAGVDVRVSTTEYSFVGVLSSLPFLPRLWSQFRAGQRMILEDRPDVVVLIDSEAAAVRMARWLRRQEIPAVFFFPPQVWFWGRWRLRYVVPLARRVLSAFRAEAAIYRAAGADVRFVGHPLLDVVSANPDRVGALRETGLDPARPIVGLMPGSRRQEIRMLARIIFDAARKLQQRDPSLQFAIPLAAESLREDLERAIAASGLGSAKLYRPTSYAPLSQARVVIQGSGTGTLETALLGIPSVIAYRCIPLEYWVGRWLMRVPYIGMVNILLGEMVQPEFFNENVDADHLADEAWSLLTDDARRRRIQQRLAALPKILGEHGVMDRAAHAVLDLTASEAREAVELLPAATGTP